MPAPPGRPRAGNPARQAAIYRRRRLFAGLAAAVAVLFLILVVRALGGSNTQLNAEAQHPSAAARNWALAARVRREAREENASVDAALAVTPVLRYGSGEKRQIALTFDDGPGPFTPEILDVLDEYDVPATFFVIGGPSDSQAALIQEEVARGHSVGNHTVGHADLATLSRAGQAAQVDGQTAAIELFGAPKPRLFRPPYNSWNETTLDIMRRRKMLMVLWSVETNDWAKPGVDAIVDRTLADAKPGAIVLFHDGGGDRAQTVAALPRVIEGLQNDGYELVTIPQLLEDSPPSSDQREFSAAP